jgi:Mn2+/Fe2+ NRAMP family transporter
LVWWLVVRGSQKRVERVFLLMSLVFFCYVISAFVSKPDWSAVGRSLVTAYVPSRHGLSLHGHGADRYDDHAVHAGHTSSRPLSKKQMDKDDLKLVRADVIVGTTFACMIAAFIVISTAGHT